LLSQQRHFTIKHREMIVKTRQRDDTHATDPAADASNAFKRGCGVLRHLPQPERYRHVRHAPPKILADWVEHFWMESWDFRGCRPQVREVLPHPSVHLVFARNRSRIWGVQLGRFVRQLGGHDRIFGVKFHPGAFHPFLRARVTSITNDSIPLHSLFHDVARTEEQVLGCATEADMADVASSFLVANLPPHDPNIETVRRIVSDISNDRRIMRIEQLAALSGIQERTLQRLFNRYVGAPMRWVIKRYRIYEAIEYLNAGKSVAWTRLAQDLGYFDQAHFINDFRKFVGCSPSAYASRGSESGPMVPARAAERPDA
jgi:AraC-like DNA-binding protein